MFWMGCLETGVEEQAERFHPAPFYFLFFFSIRDTLWCDPLKKGTQWQDYALCSTVSRTGLYIFHITSCGNLNQQSKFWYSEDTFARGGLLQMVS